MVKPLLNKPYTPWHSTDVRATFELEQRRLAGLACDQLNAAFGEALGAALVDLARCGGPQRLAETA